MEDKLAVKEEKKELQIKKLSPKEQKKVNAIIKETNIEDSHAIITYGVSAQTDISKFSDHILDQVRAKDSGHVGDVLTNLAVKIKEIDVDGLSYGGFLTKIPFLKNLVRNIKRFIARYNKLSSHVDKIIDELDQSRITLLKELVLLDKLYDKNLAFLRNLELFILAGEMKLKEINDRVLPQIEKATKNSDNPLELQKHRDFKQSLNRFEKKIHDLKLSRMIAIQTMPQIRLIQNGNQLLVDKIQDSILNTIPLWKNQIVIAISLFRQKKALKLQQEVNRTTNELLQQNAELLKTSGIEIARESEKGIVEIDTLKMVNENLITTIEETLTIQAEGKEKRLIVEKELQQIEQDLKQKLISLKNQG